MLPFNQRQLVTALRVSQTPLGGGVLFSDAGLHKAETNGLERPLGTQPLAQQGSYVEILPT